MFMATDPVTSPFTKTGKLISGVNARAVLKTRMLGGEPPSYNFV